MGEIQQILTAFTGLSATGQLIVAVWAMWTERVVTGKAYLREVERGDKAHELLAAADARVEEAKEQVRRAKAMTTNAVSETMRWKAECEKWAAEARRLQQGRDA